MLNALDENRNPVNEHLLILFLINRIFRKRTCDRKIQVRLHQESVERLEVNVNHIYLKRTVCGRLILLICSVPLCILSNSILVGSWLLTIHFTSNQLHSEIHIIL